MLYKIDRYFRIAVMVFWLIILCIGLLPRMIWKLLGFEI